MQEEILHVTIASCQMQLRLFPGCIIVPIVCLCYAHVRQTALSAYMQLEDDLFVMPTIPDSFEDGGTHHQRQQLNRTATREPLPLAMPDRHIVGLPTGLELQDTMLM